MGFLNIAEDGTTSLNILNPDHSGHVSDKERVITLGEKIGKLKAGRFSPVSFPLICSSRLLRIVVVKQGNMCLPIFCGFDYFRPIANISLLYWRSIQTAVTGNAKYVFATSFLASEKVKTGFAS